MTSTDINSNEALTLTHYKEPLVKNPDGFGYLGCILITENREKIQCHICGKLFKELPRHLKKAHETTAREYRTKFGLAFDTALISETERERRKQNMLSWWNSLTEDEKKEQRERLRAWGKLRKPEQPKIQLETKNKRGTCPDQLLAKIMEVKEKVGHTPSLAELIINTGGQRYKHLILTTFGSWANALKMLDMVPRSSKSTGHKKTYTREELLEYLTMFSQENKTLPTATDMKRRLLPDLNAYKKWWSNLEEARQEAHCYDFINPK